MHRHLRNRGGVVQGFAIDGDGVVGDDGSFIDIAADRGSGAGDATTVPSSGGRGGRCRGGCLLRGRPGLLGRRLSGLGEKKEQNWKTEHWSS